MTTQETETRKIKDLEIASNDFGYLLDDATFKDLRRLVRKCRYVYATPTIRCCECWLQQIKSEIYWMYSDDEADELLIDSDVGVHIKGQDIYLSTHHKA